MSNSRIMYGFLAFGLLIFLGASPLFAAGDQCHLLFRSPSIISLSDRGLVQRATTFFHWRKVKRDSKSNLVGAESNAADIYDSFFKVVLENHSVITEDRLRSLLNLLPRLEPGSDVTRRFLRGIIDLVQANKISDGAKLLLSVVSKIDPQDMASDREVAGDIIQLSESINKEFDSVALSIKAVVRAYSHAKLQRQDWYKIFSNFRTVTQEHVFSFSGLHAIFQTLGELAADKKANFSGADVIRLAEKKWGTSTFSFDAFDPARAKSQLLKVTRTSDYEKDRPLLGDPSSYRENFESGFFENLMGLREDQIWMDVGAGEFLPISQFYENGGRARAIGVAIETPKSHPRVKRLRQTQGKKFTAMLGKPFEDYAPGEIPSVDLITDFYGALSYSPHIDVVLAKYLALLKVGGRIDMHFDPEFNAFFLNGVNVSLSSWLASIPGIRVSGWHFGNGNIALSITKEAESVEIPSLILTRYENRLPSKRAYVIVTGNVDP